MEPNIDVTNLVDIAANLTTGDNSELNKLIQSGDLSRAVQLATAAIVAVDDTAQTQAASQEELTTKRIAVFVTITAISLSDRSTSRGLITSTLDFFLTHQKSSDIGKWSETFVQYLYFSFAKKTDARRAIRVIC